MPPRKQDKPTFIEEARRKQIIDAAVATIAEIGYVNASLAEIARVADISKGVISYHFESKDDLIDHTIDTILRDLSIFVRQQVPRPPAAVQAQLEAYIDASLRYMQENRVSFVALVDLWASFTTVERRREYSQSMYDPCRSFLTTILEQGQVRPALAATRASLIQALIDGVMLQWVLDPEAVDLAACRHEALRIAELMVQP
jgi:AcrR family transcriptional regulator